MYRTLHPRYLIRISIGETDPPAVFQGSFAWLTTNVWSWRIYLTGSAGCQITPPPTQKVPLAPHELDFESSEWSLGTFDHYNPQYHCTPLLTDLPVLPELGPSSMTRCLFLPFTLLLIPILLLSQSIKKPFLIEVLQIRSL